MMSVLFDTQLSSASWNKTYDPFLVMVIGLQRLLLLCSSIDRILFCFVEEVCLSVLDCKKKQKHVGWGGMVGFHSN